MEHYWQLLALLGSQLVTVKPVRSCNSPAFAFDGIIYQTRIRGFLLKFCINENQVQIRAGQHWFLTFILFFWGLILSSLAFFYVLCKSGGHFEVGWISADKRLAGSGKEYRFGCWVRNVTIMKLGDGIMQQHTKLTKKIKAVR